MFYCVGALLATFFSLTTAYGDVVVAPAGAVTGWEGQSRNGRVYQAWTRIPYAQPPIGELRFKAPKPASRWEGVLNATDDMPPCLQPWAPASAEDCLYLSVYSPKIVKKNLPVLFYVHGGGFLGGNAGPRNNADYIMDQDVVLVEIHYRLGIFGFSTLGDTVLPGNIGLKDQVLALRWVKKNIRAFGGNPKSVTVFGGSAGGALVHIFLNSPVCKDLVTRAVSYSGTINHVWSLLDTDYVKEFTLKVARQLNCGEGSSEEVLNCLQNADPQEILNESVVSATGQNFAHILAFAPVIEPSDSEDAVITYDLSKRPSNKSWISSVTSGEYFLFLTFAAMALSDQAISQFRDNLRVGLEQIIGNYTDDADTITNGAQELMSRYFTDENGTDDFLTELSLMYEDLFFVFPWIFNGKRHTGRKWLAHFEYKGNISYYVNIDPRTGKPFSGDVPGHAEEGLYYFNVRSMYPNAGPETPNDKEVSERLIQRLTNFAYYDNPTPRRSSLRWKQFSSNRILRITAEGDFMGNEKFTQRFENVYDLWYNLIGWKF